MRVMRARWKSLIQKYTFYFIQIADGGKGVDTAAVQHSVFGNPIVFVHQLAHHFGFISRYSVTDHLTAPSSSLDCFCIRQRQFLYGQKCVRRNIVSPDGSTKNDSTVLFSIVVAL